MLILMPCTCGTSVTWLQIDFKTTPLRMSAKKKHAWINLCHSGGDMSDLYGLEILHNVQSLSDMVRLHDRRLDPTRVLSDCCDDVFSASPIWDPKLAAQACVIPFLIPPLLAGATVESGRCRDFMRFCHTGLHK